ncbi:hypothetical protein ACFV80_11805 [Streptomyces sp. NPDC059862]|uniref:hypothetical protein n=1 Tax=Streptomyces sp. NPDC059862 TaxID=3346975 RepID=UPI0036499D5E
MKLRHVRAVAVFVGVVVALTGARHSSGGGCDSSNSSSSSSSSGGATGGSHYDDDDDYDTGATSGSGATSDTGSGASADAAKDVKIESCVFDEARGIVARVSASNPSASTTYTYEFSVTFKDPEGTLVRTSNSTIPYVSAGSTDTLDVAAAYVPASGGDGSGSSCELDDVTRTAV